MYRFSFPLFWVPWAGVIRYYYVPPAHGPEQRAQRRAMTQTLWPHRAYLLIYLSFTFGRIRIWAPGDGQKGRIEGRAKRGPEILVYISIYGSVDFIWRLSTGGAYQISSKTGLSRQPRWDPFHTSWAAKSKKKNWFYFTLLYLLTLLYFIVFAIF